MSLPTDDKARKALPIFDGVLMYFPDALLAVAAVSKAGNDQHNPGQPLHWARGKSMDQMNTALRHMMDRGMKNRKDIDGCWHLAKAAWRILAQLQLDIEDSESLQKAMPQQAVEQLMAENQRAPDQLMPQQDAVRPDPHLDTCGLKYGGRRCTCSI